MRKCKCKFKTKSKTESKTKSKIPSYVVEFEIEFEFELESACKSSRRHGNCLNYEFLAVCVYGNLGNYAKRWLTHTRSARLYSNTSCVWVLAGDCLPSCMSYNMLIATVCLFAYWIIAVMCGRFGLLFVAGQ